MTTDTAIGSKAHHRKLPCTTQTGRQAKQRLSQTKRNLGVDWKWSTVPLIRPNKRSKTLPGWFPMCTMNLLQSPNSG